MLGIGRTRTGWQWSVCGKHPAAADYIRINADMPLCAAFESWMENGYRTIAGRKNTGGDLRFWRFWAKGSNKGDVACGLCRDSSDSIGRPYPFLVIGSGFLDGWEENWDGLTDLFASTWEQIEWAAAGRFNDLKDLLSEIISLNSPGPVPPRGQKPSGFSEQIGREAREWIHRLAESRTLRVPLQDNQQDDPSAQALQWCRALKAHGAGIPHAVFEGGGIRRQYLVLWWRPLSPADFVALWSVETAGRSH